MAPVEVTFLLLPCITFFKCTSIPEEDSPKEGRLTHFLVHRHRLGALWCEDAHFTGETEEEIEWLQHTVVAVWRKSAL